MTKGKFLDDRDTVKASEVSNTHKVSRPRLAKLIGTELSSYPHLHVLALVAAGDGMAILASYIPYTHLPPAAQAAGLSPAKVVSMSL